MSFLRLVLLHFGNMDLAALLRTVVDILVVSFLIYKVLMLARGTRAWQILWGLVIFFLALSIADRFQLYTLHWLLQSFVYMGPVAIVILLYPELRHALEEMGRFRFWGSRFSLMATEQIGQIVGEIVRAAVELSQRRVGALIVIERETRLDDIIASGQPINADLSAELLLTIFHPGSPLHDQAVVVCGDSIAAASCLLPVTDDPGVGMAVHTRHRAALGMSLQSDAVVVVVSEETGAISLSYDGRLIRGLNQETLKERLADLLQPTVLANQKINWRRALEFGRQKQRERTERV